MVKNIALNQDIQQKICFKPGYTRIWKNNYYLTRILVKMLLKPGLFKKENFDFAETCTHTHTHTHTQYTIVRHLFSVQYFFIRLYSHWNHFYRKIYI